MRPIMAWWRVNLRGGADVEVTLRGCPPPGDGDDNEPSTHVHVANRDVVPAAGFAAGQMQHQKGVVEHLVQRRVKEHTHQRVAHLDHGARRYGSLYSTGHRATPPTYHLAPRGPIRHRRWSLTH